MARALPEGRVTFAFTDVEGSTALLTRLGESWPPLQRELHAQIAEQVEAVEGVVVGVEGDGSLCAFPSAGAALQALAQVQRVLDQQRWRDVPVRVRVAAHVGTAVPHEGGYTALAVHQAARLMSLAHGGQILLSQELVDELRGALPEGLQLRDLGRWHVRDFPLPENLWQLSGAGLPHRFPALRGRPADGGNLPPRTAALVGRDREVTELRGLLQGAGRLLTVAGTGGVGKTSLALLAASQHDVPVWHVQLSGASTAAHAALAVAEAVGVRCEEPDERAWGMVATALRDRRLLLLLDTCEHLLPQLGEAVQLLLDSAPEVRVLATSREPLGLAEEHVLDVLPLATPAQDAAQEAILDSPSVTLLLQQRGSAPTGAAEIEALGALARALDGLPLALELVATRLQAMTATDLLPRLRASLARSVRTTGPDRHRTLHATLAWSWDLLSVAEQRMWSRCSVFRGAFALDAAEVVCQDVPGDEGVPDVLDAVVGLVRRRLLVFLPGQPGRYAMLDSVREFGLGRLEEADGLLSRQERHAAWVAQTFQEMCRSAFEDAVGLQGQVDALRSELLAGLAHDVACRPQRALRTAAAGLWVWRWVGLLGTVASLLEPLLPMLDQLDDEAQFVLRHLQAGVLYHQGRAEEGLAHVQEANAAAARCGVIQHEVLALNSLAVCHLALGRSDRLGELLERLRALLDRAANPVERVLVERLLARICDEVGEDDALVHADAAVQLAGRHAPGLEPLVRWHRSTLHLRAGRLDVAAADAAAGLALARARASSAEIRLCLLELGWAQLGLGDAAAARRYLREARRRMAEDGDLINEAEALCKLAAATAAEGDVPAAVVLQEEAEEHPAREPASRSTPGLFDLCAALVLEHCDRLEAARRAERALSDLSRREVDLTRRAHEVLRRLAADAGPAPVSLDA